MQAAKPATAGQASSGRLPTALSRTEPSRYSFAHGHHHQVKVPLHAVRDDRRPLRLRKVLLPLPVANGRPPLPGRLVLLPTLPRSLRLYGFELNLLLPPVPSEWSSRAQPFFRRREGSCVHRHTGGAPSFRVCCEGRVSPDSHFGQILVNRQKLHDSRYPHALTANIFSESVSGLPISICYNDVR